MEIPLLVLVLQIGFNAALNNRGYSSNSVIPSPRFINSGQTRRLPDTYNFMSLSSRGIPESDEQTDSEYSNSFEEYSYRSVRPLQSRSDQKRNDYLSYDTRPGNDVSLEAAPVRRINSDNYADSFQQSSYLSRRTDPYFRRPYNRPSNLIPRPTPQYYRKANDDLSLEVSSLESSNTEDASRLGEEANYLRSLLSLIEQPSNRRGQNRKYYRQGNSLSIDMSPVEKLNPYEEAVNNLQNSLNKRRNNNPDAYADTFILVNDDDQPGQTPKSVSPQPTNLGYNTLYNRRYDDELNHDEDFYNHLSPFHGPNLRQREQKLTNDNPLTRKVNRKSNNNAGAESPFNDELFTDGDTTGKLTVLRLASLEDLNHSNNRKSNHRNFLRLSLNPDNKLTLDEGVASDLSEILSETLDELNLAPVNLRRTDVTSNKYGRRENNRNSVEEDYMNNMFLLRLGNSYNPNTASSLRRYSKPASHSRNRNLRTHGNHTRKLLKKVTSSLLSGKSVDLPPLKPSESNGRNGNLQKHGNHARQNSTSPPLKPSESNGRNGNLQKHGNHARQNSTSPPLKSDESTDHSPNSNLKTHGNHARQNSTSTPLKSDESTDHSPNSNLKTHENHVRQNSTSPPLKSDVSTDHNSISNLRTHGNHARQNIKKLFDEASAKTLVPYHGGKSNQLLNNGKNENQNNNSRNDGLSDKFSLETLSFKKKGHTSDNLTVLPPINQQNLSLETPLLKSSDDILPKNTTDKLHLEFPWNDQMSPDGDKSKSELRSDDKKDDIKNNTLNLEFPWNNALSYDKGKSQLRTDERKNKTKDTLDLEFPWNDILSPDPISVSGKSQLRSDEKKDKTKDNLRLEFPWNDALSPDSDKSKSQLRSDDKKDKTKDNLRLEFPWNDALSPDSDKGKSQLRSDDKKDRTKHNLRLEFPWNDALSPDSDKGKSQLRSDDKKDKTKDNLRLEFPWNDALSSDSDKGKSQLRSDDKKNKTKDNLRLEFPWNDALSPDSDKGKSQLRSDKKKDKTKDNLHLEFPWNDALSSDSNQNKSQLRTDEAKEKTNDSTDKLNLEFPWNDAQNPDADKGKSQLRTDRNMENTIDHTDSLDLEFPWNDALSPDSHKRKSPLRSKDDTKNKTNTLNLEFPWNDQLSPDKIKAEGSKPKSLLRNQADNHQGKEQKDELKLDFPWNDKTSPDKPLTKQTTLRIPDPFFIHPYLRNRNVIKHPNYFRRSYDKFSEGLRLQNLRDKTSAYHRRQSNRRRNDNLGVLRLARRSSDKRRQRLRTRENTPALATTTYRPKYIRSFYRAGRKGDRDTYNDTIIFPSYLPF